MLDSVLAELYQVDTKTLNRSVQRNLKRFPADFMFQLNGSEIKNLKYQIGTSSWGGRRKQPYVFTELGVAMLSSVLHSDRAVQMNIFIMRAFVQLRELIATNKEVATRMDALERRQDKQSEHLVAISTALKKLADEPVRPKGRMGFER